MRESAVGFGHPVGVFTLLDGCTTIVRGIEQLAGEAVDHGRLVAVARSGDDPANGKGLTTLETHLDRHLIRRTTDATRTNLDGRAHISERLVGQREGALARLSGFLAVPGS